MSKDFWSLVNKYIESGKAASALSKVEGSGSEAHMVRALKEVMGKHEAEMALEAARKKALEEAMQPRAINQENASRAFELLKQAGQPTYYRHDIPSSTRKLLTQGFDEETQLSAKTAGWGEVSGIFAALREKDLGPLISGSPHVNYRDASMEIVPFKNARIKAFTEREWDKDFLRRGPREITKELKQHFDFVEFPDVIQGNINPETGLRYKQVVQINPQKSLVKVRKGEWDWKNQKEVYKILGLTGAATGAALTAQAILPDESDAAILQQVGKAAKAMTRAMKKGLPSTSERELVGRTLPAFGEDSVIAEVKSLGGNRRAIKFEDGRVFSAHKDDLHGLSKMFGTEDRLNVFQEAAHENKIDMALKSLKFHEDHTKYHQLRTKGSIKTQQAEHRAYVEDWIQNMARYSDSPALEKQALVKNLSTGRQYLILEDYAQILERMGLVKINRIATRQIRELSLGTQKGWKK